MAETDVERNPLIQELAAAHGIASEFWDWQGTLQQVPDSTLVAVLAALDVDASSPESAQQGIYEAEKKSWQRLIEPVVVVEEGNEKHVTIHVEAGAPAEVMVRLEEGGGWPLSQAENYTEDREYDGQWFGEATFVIPNNLPMGYHRLQVSSHDRIGEAQLIVTPTWVGFPKSIEHKRIWGYAAQFYSARSELSWGIGDFVDLADLTTWAKTQHNASFVLINPVHAAEPMAPMQPSPYSPTSRRYVNPIYIRVEAIPEYNDLSEKKRQKISTMADQLRSTLDPDRLDRNTAWTQKLRALRMVFGAGLRPARQMAFDDFRRREGRHLHHFATWCALVSEFGPNFHDWPEPYRRPSSPEVSQFVEAHPKRIRFYCWLQWIVDTQLSEAQLAATNVGMPIGIINDLAVGISGVGADAWAMPDVFAHGVHVGAPADAYNQLGQDWGMPPWRPDRLADLGYAPFRTMVSGILSHSGGVRIDHIMGLFRLWWVPEGALPSQGTYVRYDHEAMVGILALEALRAGALVIGEDLGTVEPWVREYLARRGILGTSILWFEYGEDGQPLAPEHWRQYSMASVTTHDLPPTAGYLAGDHVKLRNELGLLTTPFEEEMALTQAELDGWRARLRERGFLEGDDADVEAEVLALHRYLVSSSSQVLAVSLVDAVGDARIQNQPGTSDEYPNWRVPLSGPDGAPVVIEDIFDSPRAASLAAVMNGWEIRE